MTNLTIKPLDHGAIEICDFDITNFTWDTAQEIRKLLLTHLVVVIKEQDTNSLNYAHLISYIGLLGNWQQFHTDFESNSIGFLTEYPDFSSWDKNKFFPIQSVTGKKTNGEFNGIFPLGKLDWHCNLNGPDRADGVALQGIKGVEGTRTSWLNTAIALQEMPDDLYNRLKGKHATFSYSPLNWADIHNETQRQYMLMLKNEYKMYIEQENAMGVKGLYLYTNNECQIVGDDDSLYEDLKDFLFQEKYMYHHDWNVGDIVLSDQLLTLHKRRLETDAIFEERLLNRITFRLSNVGDPLYIVSKNTF